MQDNDPKHTSRYAKHINWWKTPASSPDLNPIENVWHTMKEYLRSDYKSQMNIVLSPSEDGDSDVSEIELVSEQNVLECGVALYSRSTQTSLSVKPPSGTVLCYVVMGLLRHVTKQSRS